MNDNGTLIATASSTGQNLKIYETDNLSQLYDFRRGSETADIYNMAFNIDDKYFICSSNRCTLHIFCLTDNNEQRNKNPVKFLEKMVSVVKKIGSDDYMTKQSSFAQLKFDEPSICIIYDKNKILAVNSSGCLLGDFDTEKGGHGLFSRKLEFNPSNTV